MLTVNITEQILLYEEFKHDMLSYIEKKAPYIYHEINKTGKLSESIKNDIVKFAREYLSLVNME